MTMNLYKIMSQSGDGKAILRNVDSFLRPTEQLVDVSGAKPIPPWATHIRAQLCGSALGVVLLDNFEAVFDPSALPFEVRSARYARGKAAVFCHSESEFMTRAMRLCVHLKGQYSKREHAYIMSWAKVQKLMTLWRDGKDACAVTGELLERETEGSQL